jgi:hypothetical protein
LDEKNIENRLTNLEEQVGQILSAIHSDSSKLPKVKDWRRSLGMFDQNSLMKEIDKEGERIRKADREQVANDYLR